MEERKKEINALFVDFVKILKIFYERGATEKEQEVLRNFVNTANTTYEDRGIVPIKNKTTEEGIFDLLFDLVRQRIELNLAKEESSKFALEQKIIMGWKKLYLFSLIEGVPDPNDDERWCSIIMTAQQISSEVKNDIFRKGILNILQILETNQKVKEN